MKNHIKNYIKIMGLASVPFRTAQAVNYEIKVTQKHKPDAEHFRISIGEAGKEPHVAEIVWSNKKGYPNPIFEPNGFMEMYEDEWKVEPRRYKYHYHNDKPRYFHRLKRSTRRNAWINLLKWYGFYGNRLPAANWEYHVRKACEGLGLRVVLADFAEKIKEFIGNDDESERKKKLFCNFEAAVVLDVTNRSVKRFGGGEEISMRGESWGCVKVFRTGLSVKYLRRNVAEK